MLPPKTLAFLLVFLTTRLYAQSPAQRLVDGFATGEGLAGAVVSVNVIEVDNGRSVASHFPTMAAIPASTQKLITTAAAMDLLGPAYTFRTRLILEGRVTAGVLDGNVHIVGGGDPTLGSPYMRGVPDAEELMQQWAAALAARGIREIRGQIIGDGSYYGTDGVGFAWPWSDIGNYYGAGAYGLNVHENFYFLDLVQRQQVGSTPPIRGMRPPVGGLNITNELRSGPRGSGDQAYIYGAPFTYDHYLRGSIPVGTGRFTIKGSLPDPPLYAARLLERELAARGITVSAPATSARLSGLGDFRSGQVIDEVVSPPLAEIVDRTNMRSNNLYAEALLREINKARGAVRSELAGTELVREWLSSQGLNTENIQLEDGSGLAPRNFFSTRFMTDFLRARAGDRRWVASIPVAGRSGAMRHALKNTVAVGRVAAKSGSLDAVRAYAGYIDRPDGRRLAFAFMVNNSTLAGSELRRRMLYLMRDLCTVDL